jgi:signal transduction histidine kinase
MPHEVPDSTASPNESSLSADLQRALDAADIARRQLEALLEHLPVGITLAEAPSGRLLVSNAAVSRIWGLDTPAAKVADYSALYIGYHLDEGPGGERRYENEEWPLARALMKGEVVLDELIEIQWPDGSRRFVSVSAAPVRDAHGNIVNGVVMTQDVHDREMLLVAEREARAQTERLQALTSALARAHTLDDVATVVVTNMVETLGARTGSLALVSPEGEAMVLFRTAGFPDSAMRRAKRQPMELQSPLTVCFKSQQPVWLETRHGEAGLDALYPPIAPIWDTLQVNSAAFVPLMAPGKTIGVISFAFADERKFTDADRAFLSALGQQSAVAVERARLFDAEHRARAEAERANKAKSEFLAVMSHELRTPLQAIDGYAEIMEMGLHGPLTDDQRQDLARIRRSEQHLLGLINGVLNYAQVEAGVTKYEIEMVPVQEILDVCEPLIVPQAQAKGLQLSVDSVASSVTVRADREKTQQIIINLLSNAVKFTADGGEVRLTCELVFEGLHSWVQLTVSDSGIGISATDLPRVFEPFVQLDSSSTRSHHGTGLGLAISRDLARGMGGDVTAESAPGEGSRFVLRLPLAWSSDTLHRKQMGQRLELAFATQASACVDQSAMASGIQPHAAPRAND